MTKYIMPYKYLDHQADIGILGEGESWSEAFEEAARAMFNLIGKQEEKVAIELKNVEIEVSAKDIETLFVEWLNELLAQRDLTGLFFSDFKISEIKKTGDVYKLQGQAFGLPFSEENFVRGLDVKAATYGGLKCEKKEGNYSCQCILDI
jgi:SHS2 domain-containing protein